MTSYVFVTFTWRKCFRTNIYLLGLTITFCCQTQTERNFICAYKITAHTQYMPTAALQYIWSRAADWLSEPTVNPFMFSMWVKLCVTFCCMGNKHWFVILLISGAPSDGIILSPTGCSLIWGGRRVRGGERLQTLISMITLSEIENRGELIRVMCERNRHFSRYLRLSFHYETSLSHLPIKKSPQCGKTVSDNSTLPKPQPSQYCI